MRIGIALAQLGRQAAPGRGSRLRRGGRDPRLPDGLGARPAAVTDCTAPVGTEACRRVPPPEDQATTSLDPMATLSFGAACTERVRLGVDVPVAPWYPTQCLLARALTGIDVLRRGRLTVGLGHGWSPGDNAVGRSMTTLTTAQEETFDVFDGDLVRSVRRAHGHRRADPPVDHRTEAGAATTAADPARCELARRFPTSSPPGRRRRRPVCRSTRWLRASPPCGTGLHATVAILTAWSSSSGRTSQCGRTRFDAIDRSTTARSTRWSTTDLETQAAGAHEVFLHLAGDYDLDVSLAAYAALADGLALRTRAA